jgi:hypothetical protein
VGIAALLVLCTGLVTTATAGAPLPAREATRAGLTAAPSPTPAVLPLQARRTVRPPRPPHLVPAGPVPASAPLTGCPAKPRPPGGPARPQPPATVPEAALPAPVALSHKASDLGVVRGKGLWVTPFATTQVDVPALVTRAHRLRVRSLWIRTGGRQGYYGDHFLPALVPAAHAAGIAVIAWDFPTLSDPVADALRAQRVLRAGIDAFSPDVETAAEGTYPTARRIALYLSLVRVAAGTRPVVATIPRPTAQRLATFPYRAFVPYADVFAPMVYWSCREPGALVAESLARLGRLLPVAPVGQAYDMASEGGRRGTPSRAETLRFLDAARRGGAIGASLWTVEEAGPAQLTALADYPWR